MKKNIKSSVLSILSIGAFFAISPQMSYAQTSQIIDLGGLTALIETSISELGADKSEDQVQDGVIKVLSQNPSSNSVVSSALVSVVKSAQKRSDQVTVDALTDIIYDQEDFECSGVENLIIRINISIEKLGVNRTEIDVQDKVEDILGQCYANDDVVAEALTSVIQSAQLRGDDITVLALTTLVEDLDTEILEGSGDLAGNNAQGAPISVPPSILPVGGSDY